MKMKRNLALILSSAMFLSMAGCGSNDVSAQKEEGGQSAVAQGAASDAATDSEGQETPNFSGVTLRFAWWGSQTRHDLTIQAIEEYEALTGIDIEYEYYDFNGYFTQLDTLAAAGDVWDVFQLGNNWATYYDIIEPLNPFLGNGIDVSDINQPLLKITEDYDGNQMGISLGTNCRCMVYNPALFEKAGVKLPDDTWTWDDFYNACATIHEKTGAYGMAKTEYYEMLIAACTQMGEGYNFFEMDGSDFAIKDDVSALAKIFDIVGDLEADGAIADPGVQAEILDEQGDPICTGDSAMLLIPSNKYVSLNAALQEGVSVKLALLPKLTEDSQSGMLVRSSQMVSMSKNCKNQEAAVDFINYLINSVDANTILNGERGVPVNTTVREALADSADEVTADIYSFVGKISGIEDTANTSNAEPPALKEIQDITKTYFEKLFAGEFASGEECAQAFYKECQNIFAQY